MTPVPPVTPVGPDAPMVRGGGGDGDAAVHRMTTRARPRRPARGRAGRIAGREPVRTADGCACRRHRGGVLRRAVVVVEPGPGPLTICFDGSISGLEALQLAGANPVTYGFAGQGAAVCQLFGVGNPADVVVPHRSRRPVLGVLPRRARSRRLDVLAAVGATQTTVDGRIGRGLAVRHRRRAGLRQLLQRGRLRPAADGAARRPRRPRHPSRLHRRPGRRRRRPWVTPTATDDHCGRARTRARAKGDGANER